MKRIYMIFAFIVILLPCVLQAQGVYSVRRGDDGYLRYIERPSTITEYGHRTLGINLRVPDGIRKISQANGETFLQYSRGQAIYITITCTQRNYNIECPEFQSLICEFTDPDSFDCFDTYRIHKGQDWSYIILIGEYAKIGIQVKDGDISRFVEPIAGNEIAEKLSEEASLKRFTFKNEALAKCSEFNRDVNNNLKYPLNEADMLGIALDFPKGIKGAFNNDGIWLDYGDCQWICVRVKQSDNLPDFGDKGFIYKSVSLEVNDSFFLSKILDKQRYCYHIEGNAAEIFVIAKKRNVFRFLVPFIGERSAKGFASN